MPSPRLLRFLCLYIQCGRLRCFKRCGGISVYTFFWTCHCYTPQRDGSKSLLPSKCPLDPARMYITFVVETFGLWLSHSLDISKWRLALQNQLIVSQSTSHLYQQLSIQLWLYYSKIILERLVFEKREDTFGLI